MKKRRILFLAAFLLLRVFGYSQDNLPKIMSEELQRNMETLKKEKTPPYYMSYRINDIKTYTIQASFGQLTSSKWSRSRKLCTSVRVGSPKLDNTHPIKGEDYGWFERDRGVNVPLEESPEGIKQTLWAETNSQYMRSNDMYAKVQANVAIKVEDEDKSEDFSQEKPVVYSEPMLTESDYKFDITSWEKRLMKYTAILLENNQLQEGSASFSYNFERKYFVASDGSTITENRITCRVHVSGETMADDGMKLPLYNSYFAFNPNQLASDEQMINETKHMSEILSKLRVAPIVDSYTGPALLAAASAGVFFHEIFGHRVEGQRMKSENDAQTFKKKVGEKVINENLSIYFDPTISKYKSNYLNGSYKYDDQGQLGQKVNIVENGIMKSFLMSRTPITGFANSNGHGRAEAGMQVVTRQSNLIIETNKPLSDTELRKMLIEEAKKQGKDYGYFFVSTVGGFTFTGRYMPNSFNVTPVEVYRIYVDGRPDELIRGVDLVGTPLSIFSNIEAAGNNPGIFTGTCGAESGWVPTTTVCPTLFIKQIETQRKAKNQSKKPILPRP